MRCVLVPLRPNEEMAARRGRPRSGQGMLSVRRVMWPVVQSTWGGGWSAWRVWGGGGVRGGVVRARWGVGWGGGRGGGGVLWWRAWMILMMLAAPAAAWVWPMLDLMEARCRGVWGLRWCP